MREHSLAAALMDDADAFLRLRLRPLDRVELWRRKVLVKRLAVVLDISLRQHCTCKMGTREYPAACLCLDVCKRQMDTALREERQNLLCTDVAQFHEVRTGFSDGLRLWINAVPEHMQFARILATDLDAWNKTQPQLLSRRLRFGNACNRIVVGQCNSRQTRLFRFFHQCGRRILAI